MATATTAYVSSSIFNRIFNNLSFTHSSISLTTINFPQRPISQKPFNLTLKSQSFNLSSLPLQSHHPPFVPPSQDTSDKPKQDEQQKVTTSDHGRRLFVGNFPFAITDSQLAEIFEKLAQLCLLRFFSFILNINLFFLLKRLLLSV